MRVTIESIGKIQSFGDKGFTKREFIAVDNSNPEYPTPIKFEVIKDKCALLDKFTEGQEVDVEFNITGRRWKNPQGIEVIFNGFQAWKITEAGASMPHDLTPAHDEAEEDATGGLPF